MIAVSRAVAPISGGILVIWPKRSLGAVPRMPKSGDPKPEHPKGGIPDDDDDDVGDKADKDDEHDDDADDDADGHEGHPDGDEDADADEAEDGEDDGD